VSERLTRSFLILQSYEFRIVLRSDHEFGGEEALLRVLREVGAVDDVGHKLRAEWQRHIVAVDVARLFAIDDEQVIALLLDGDVGIFARFDVAVGSENKQAAVAPRSKAIGSEPVEAHIA